MESGFWFDLGNMKYWMNTEMGWQFESDCRSANNCFNLGMVLGIVRRDSQTEFLEESPWKKARLIDRVSKWVLVFVLVRNDLVFGRCSGEG